MPAPDILPAAAPAAPPRSGLRAHLRTLVAACFLVAALYALFGVFVHLAAKQNPAETDYIEYWAAGHLLIHHANPYDPAALLAIQRAAGYTGSQARISFSPPVALFFALPLGYIGAKGGFLLWIAAQLGSIYLSLQLLWRLNGRPASKWHLLGFVFAPVLTCLMAGQLGNFFLLCLALFLSLHRTRPFLAGLVLMPLALKPHLFLPFALALAIWIVLQRGYRILAGFGLALAASCALSLSFDPHVWLHYRQMMQQSHVLDIFIPALSVELRFLIARHVLWIQFLPEIAACLWTLWYFWTRRAAWDWNRHGLLLLLVGAICTPYGWYYDEAILLPAVLAGYYTATRNQRSLLPLVLIGSAAFLESVASVPLQTPKYLWTAPCWLAWFLYATSPRAASAREPAQEANA